MRRAHHALIKHAQDLRSAEPRAVLHDHHVRDDRAQQGVRGECALEQVASPRYRLRVGRPEVRVEPLPQHLWFDQPPAEIASG